jgi:hypothetical protein
MREILLGSEVPPYLDESGQALLHQARTTAVEVNLTSRRTLPLGPERSWLLTWSGSKINQTLIGMMITLDVHPSNRLIAVEMPMPENQIAEFVGQLLRRDYNPEHLALAIHDFLPGSKYDWTLGPELIALRNARQYIDVDAAKKKLDGVFGRDVV